MKCYTWHRAEVTRGIAVDSDGILILGGEMRGYEKVRCFPKKPAEIDNGFIYEAHPIKKRTTSKKDYLMLARPTEIDARVLVRINTRWIQNHRTEAGSWKSVRGTPETLMVGYGYLGMSFRNLGWCDGLVTMLPGDVIKITPAGGRKTAYYALFYDEDGVQSMSYKDYFAITDLESYTKL